MPIGALVAEPAAQVACGKDFSLVLTAAGGVLSFGANGSGQLGRRTPQGWDAAPTPVEGLASARARRVSGGAAHALCACDDGALFSWGGGAAGCLGHGDEEAQLSARAIEALRGVRVRDCAAGDEFSLAVDGDGALWSWGCGDEGRLGHADEEACHTPRRVAALAATPVRGASAGGDHSVVLSEAGEVWTFGCGEEGQLGHGDRANQLEPRRVAALEGQRVAEARAGFFYTAALMQDGSLRTWGHGEGGKLGHGDEEAREVPTVCGALEGCLV